MTNQMTSMSLCHVRITVGLVFMSSKERATRGTCVATRGTCVAEMGAFHSM